jgi:hypothetical protein
MTRGSGAAAEGKGEKKGADGYGLLSRGGGERRRGRNEPGE